jgi:hypothetical protein
MNRHTLMRQRTGKFAFALCLLLMLSQWLSLAHATEHSLESGDVLCQICTLQHHFQAATVEALPGATVFAGKFYSRFFNTRLVSTATLTRRPIRAPPL